MAKCTGMRCPMQHGYKVDECNNTDCPYRTEPITNADRIRAMNDEKLAKECVRQFPMYLWPTEVRTIYFDFENHNKNNAVNAWLEWLKQPAE